jgi:NAD-dependent deacetylase
MPIELGRSDRLFVLSGAGISAESGIPTFRGVNGLWEGHRIEEVATPEAFDANPEMVWRFYSMRRERALECTPNSAHLALAELESRLGERMTLCTQNVDALHEEAGSQRVIHMHGELFVTRCSRENCQTVPFHDDRLYPTREEIPNCECGALVRPHICWFGEIPFRMEEVFDALERCSVFLTVGTSGVVQPAASFVQQARRNGARTYYVGPEEPANVLSFQEVFLGKAGGVLPGLFRVE